MKIKTTVVAGALMFVFGTAQAALFDRGGGLLYDDVLKVTWLQDAAYARHSGYANGGYMAFSEAQTWATNLSYYDSVRGVTYDDWRLPDVSPVNGSAWNNAFQIDGSSDVGINITSPNSELSYMYYVNLGLTSVRSSTGEFTGTAGIFGNGTASIGDPYHNPSDWMGYGDVGPVLNLQSIGYYWSGKVSATDPSQSYSFAEFMGAQLLLPQDNYGIAWAVRDGDVASVATPVPEPETYAMMMAGLGLLGAVARRRKDKQQ